MGHRIIEINGTSAVAMNHDDIVHLLSCTVGDVSFHNYINYVSFKFASEKVGQASSTVRFYHVRS